MEDYYCPLVRSNLLDVITFSTGSCFERDVDPVIEEFLDGGAVVVGFLGRIVRISRVVLFFVFEID